MPVVVPTIHGISDRGARWGSLKVEALNGDFRALAEKGDGPACKLSNMASSYSSEGGASVCPSPTETYMDVGSSATGYLLRNLQTSFSRLYGSGLARALLNEFRLPLFVLFPFFWHFMMTMTKKEGDTIIDCRRGQLPGNELRGELSSYKETQCPLTLCHLL